MVNERLGRDLRITDTDNWLNPESGGLVLSDHGDADTIDDAALVDQALRLRLNTRKGELWAHPDYGNPVYDILSDLMTDEWFARAISGLTDCINDEPRASCTGVTYTAVPQERRVEFTIQYKIVDGRQGNLIWNYAAEEAINRV